MTFDHHVHVPRITGIDSLTERIVIVQRTFTFTDLCLIPKQVLLGSMNVNKETLMWSALRWALPSDQYALLDDMPMSSIREQVSWWEEQSGITLDEVVGLLRTVTRHKSEAEFDLIQAGLRLRDCPSEQFNWRDLMVLVKHADRHTRLFKACHPDAAEWDLNNQLLATAVDLLRWLQWAKTDKAQDPDSMPDPWPRPGVKSRERDLISKAGRPRKGMTIEKAKARFDRPTDAEQEADRAAKLYKLFR